MKNKLTGFKALFETIELALKFACFLLVVLLIAVKTTDTINAHLELNQSQTFEGLKNG